MADPRFIRDDFEHCLAHFDHVNNLHEHHDPLAEAGIERWRREREEALVHVARNRDRQTLDAWRTIESEIDAEIIRRRTYPHSYPAGYYWIELTEAAWNGWNREVESDSRIVIAHTNGSDAWRFMGRQGWMNGTALERVIGPVRGFVNANRDA